MELVRWSEGVVLVRWSEGIWSWSDGVKVCGVVEIEGELMHN